MPWAVGDDGLEQHPSALDAQREPVHAARRHLAGRSEQREGLADRIQSVT